MAVNVSEFVINNNDRKEIIHLNDQAIRSSTSAALNYGETQRAESKRDFIHKLSIVMKELRETSVNITIINDLNKNSDQDGFKRLIKECDELLAIFYKTIQTTRKNM